MANDATIIVGSLNDKELRNAIDQLVKHIDNQSNAMAKSFDSAIEKMKKSLQSLEKSKIDLGVNSATGSASQKRKKETEDEAAAAYKAKISYEEMAMAQQKAAGVKSARESYLAFQQGFKAQAEALTKQIQDVEQALNKAIANRVNEINAQITNAKTKLNELYVKLAQEREKMQQTGNYSMFNAGLERTKQQIDYTIRHIEELKRKIAETPSSMTNSVEIQRINNLRAERERVLNIMKEEVNTQRQITNEGASSITTTQQRAVQEQHVTEEIRRQAQAIRESREWETKGKGYYHYKYNDAEGVERHGMLVVLKQSELSIEQQIEQVHRRIADEAQKAARTTQETTTTVQQQVQIERQITQEYEKRAKYKSPVTSINESFRQMTANKLGINLYELTKHSSEISRLTQHLNQLNQAFNKLNSFERNSAFGKQLREEIQIVNRELQKYKSLASRPVSLEQALGLSTKTLDDISYKLRMLSNYRAGINLTSPNAAQELRTVNTEIERLQQRQRQLMSENQRLIGSNNALGRSFEYIKNRLAFYFTVGAAASFTKELYNIRGQYELLERSIGILVDSLQQGSQIFAEINAMAIKSPFTTMELGAAAKQLVAYDIAAKDVVDTTKRIADMAAAVGVPIDRLTYALGQVKAYGYLNARDARMFANAGIPLVKELADRFTELEGRMVSVGDVYDRIKKKAISFEEVMDVINKITGQGGRFYNFQEKAADTLKVKLANLTLAYNNMMNQIGKSHQSVLTLPLSVMKSMFENWRKLINILESVAWAFGLVKAAQMAMVYFGKAQTSAYLAGTAKQMGALANSAKAAWASVAAFGSNPWNWAMIGAGVLVYLISQYNDLRKANDEFNKSLRTNNEENVKSIDKFFEDYKKEFSTVSSTDLVEQQKTWERLQEEIDKTTKNAVGYLRVLKNIGNTDERIDYGTKILNQIQEIDKEAKRLAEHGYFSVGGGFANDSLARDIKDYQDALNDLIQTYGSLEKADEHFQGREKSGGGIKFTNKWGEYAHGLREVKAELNDFVGALDNANISKILGSGNDLEVQMSNLREFTSIVRENFLATEEGSKLNIEGRVLLNQALDEWIAKQGVSNGLIDDERAKIEANRSAWEIFFDQLNAADRERLEYMIQSNQTTSDEFKELWDKAAKNMKETSTTAYNFIQGQIASLRATPDIVIRIVYKETIVPADEQQKDFAKEFLTPQGKGPISADAYDEERKRLNKLYGRFQRKENEDNVEWEKRLGDLYRENTQKIGRLNGQLDKRNVLSEAARKQKQKELNDLKTENESLDKIAAKQGFNYKTDSQMTKEQNAARSAAAKQAREALKKQREAAKMQKQEEDAVAKALKDEISLIKEMQGNYDKLRKAGLTNTQALDIATQGYEKTIKGINAQLTKFGITAFDAKDFAGKDVNELLSALKSQLNTLLRSGKVKQESVKTLEVEIQKLTVEAKTYNLKKITDGLNNELGKLKEEYELAVEMDGNPELSNVFKDMFGIDTSEFPDSIDEYMSKVQDLFDNAVSELGYGAIFADVWSTTEAELREWGKTVGMDTKYVEDLVKMLNTAQGVAKKWAQDMVKQTEDLEYKLADTNGKIAIEEKKLQQLRQRLAEETNEKQKKLLELQIKDQEDAIARLRDELFQLLPTYEALFGGIAEHSAAMTRKLAKQLKEMLENATPISDGKFLVTDPRGGTATITKKQRGQYLDKANKELLKSQSIIQKLREAFTKGEDEIVDYVQGIEYIGEELQKLGDLVNAIGDITQALGLDEGSQETIGDIAETLNGLGQAAQGYAKLQGGDIIGGATDMITGTWKSISTWFDNSDKKITRKIEASQRAVRELELAYKDLEYAVEHSLGAQEIAARRSELANKQLQLQEKERQLELEKSRKKKNQDENAIASLEGEIADLRNEIKDLSSDVANTLLGSDIKSAAEDFVSTWVSAWRQGGDTIEALEGKFDGMIDTMIAKSLAAKVVARRLQPIYDIVDTISGTETDEEMKSKLKQVKDFIGDGSFVADIDNFLTTLYGYLGIGQGASANKSLSALQQGIQSITEDTAGALEGYMNGVSQQVYYQSDLLTQIRDAVVTLDNDVTMATQAQMLLQLQNNYIIMQTMASLMNGWTTPSGQGIRVELIS